MNNSTKVEQTLRDVLHDAADHASLAPPVALAETRTRASVARNRPRALVAACVVALGVAVAIGTVVATRDDGNGVQVAAPGESSGEVPVTDIPRTSADLEVFMTVQASDDEISAVHDQIATSVDVARYTYLDREAQYLEFSQVFACNPDLVRSIHPGDLPASFRIQTTGPEATASLRATLDVSPGVETTQAPGEATSTPSCSDTRGAEPEPPDIPATTIPSIAPALPEAGEQPTDPTSSHDAVVSAFVQAWDGSSSVEQRRAAMQGSDQLATELDRARSGNEATIATMKAVVGDVTFVAPDRAAVVFHLEFQAMTYPDRLGDAVLDGGVWKVSRETVCDVLQMTATVSCPLS